MRLGSPLIRLLSRKDRYCYITRTIPRTTLSALEKTRLHGQ